MVVKSIFNQKLEDRMNRFCKKDTWVIIKAILGQLSGNQVFDQN